MSGRVQVYCRLRPQLQSEFNAGSASPAAAAAGEGSATFLTGDTASDGPGIMCHDQSGRFEFRKDSGDNQAFVYDGFFGPESGQHDVYEGVASNIVADVEGD